MILVLTSTELYYEEAVSVKLEQLWKALKGDNFAKHYVLRKIIRLFHRSKDDFHWNIYTHHYRGEMEQLAKDHILLLKTDDYVFRGQHLEKNNQSIKPLHPNWSALYETILQLQPKSVVEAGCGNGMHLHNLKVLSPDLVVSGLDRSSGQLEYLKELNPELEDCIKIFDLTQSLPQNLSSSADVCYSQAVIMHIKTNDLHMQALANMFTIATKQVVLMENWKHHHFMDDILSLHSRKMIPWKQVYLYYRLSQELQKPHIMVCSSVPLDYPVLDNYDTLRNEVHAV